MLKRIFGILILALLVVACGARKTGPKASKSNAEAAGVIERHYENETDFKTLSGRLRTVYKDEDRSQSVTLSFRMEKDKAIWLNAQVMGFPVARAYITPSRVSYYEKISKTYFDGDFSLLSDMLGTPLDFQKLQNLLIGQSIYDMRDEAYELSQSPRGFQLAPVENGIIKRVFLLSAENYKTVAQQLSEERANRSVTVTYSDYQNVNGKLFPQDIKIVANEAGKSTSIDLTYRSLEIDSEVSFPFEIPSGYEEIAVD